MNVVIEKKQPHRWTSETAAAASKKRKTPYAWSSTQARAASLKRTHVGPKLYTATRKRGGRYEYQLPDGQWVSRQMVHLHRLHAAAEAADPKV